MPDRATLAAREEEALKAAIEARDSAAISKLVIAASSTKIRQLAAQAVDDPVALRQLIRDVRGGNDKNVYKILTAKRDVLLAEERSTERLRAEIAAAAAALERHSHRPFDPLFGATLNQLEIRWKAVAADAPAETSSQVEVSVNRARGVIRDHTRQLEEKTQRELDRAKAAAAHSRQRTADEEAAAVAAAVRAQVVESERIEQAKKLEAQTQALREIGGLIRRAQGALNGGGTRRASELRRKIDAQLATAPPLPAYLTHHLAQLDAKLNELEDWKNFAVSPKRLELVEEMESLIGATLEPVALADRIKTLQNDWRTLNKGAGGTVESEQQRFQEAAQKAYQPCKDYFEAQALLRRENLQRREALSQRLAAFESTHDWAAPDWKLVMTALRESRQEWHRYAPVDRAAAKTSQETFSTIWERLQARLDAEYSRNAEARRTLIERAQRLLSSEDSRQAIDEAKELQQHWKALGPASRDLDHSLWEEFRQHCDAVFQKRQQEFVEYTAQLEGNKSKAIALCEGAEGIATLTGPELMQKTKGLADLRASFDAIGEFPRGVSRDLRARFERALQRCEGSLDEQRRADEEQMWTQLFEAANHVRAHQRSKSDALAQSAEQFIGSVRVWPKGALETLRRALASDHSGDAATNEAALRMICVRAEVFCGLSTPAEDQALRREYQVKRLMQTMGQGSAEDDARLDALSLEWIAVGPTDEAVYVNLFERLMRCRRHKNRGPGPS